MNQIWDVDTGPRARQTDPETSHEAAASIKLAAITVMKKGILEALESPRTDEELIEYFQRWGWAGSPSGIRTRRSELEKSGQVREVGKSKTESGRRCGVFQVVK